MTNNKLTDEKIKRRINAIEDRRSASRDFWDGDYEYPECIELLALRDLQERRKADSSEPVLYAMRGANLDTDAVSTCKSVVDGWVAEWNQERKPGEPEYKTVPLYAAPPAPVVNAEPVAWQFKAVNGEWISISGTGKDQAVSEGCEIRQLYTTPPAPVVPDEIEPDSDNTYDYVDGWNACRAAMLQAGNSPVTPDGWINCRERLPKPNKYVLVCNGVWVGVGMYNNAELFEDDERWQDEHGEFIDLLHHPVTHWQSLPAAPKQTEG